MTTGWGAEALGQAAYRDVPAAFSRWCRTDDVSVPDMAILAMWRSTTAAKRAFWTEDGAVTAAAAAQPPIVLNMDSPGPSVPYEPTLIPERVDAAAAQPGPLRDRLEALLASWSSGPASEQVSACAAALRRALEDHLPPAAARGREGRLAAALAHLATDGQWLTCTDDGRLDIRDELLARKSYARDALAGNVEAAAQPAPVCSGCRQPYDPAKGCIRTCACVGPAEAAQPASGFTRAELETAMAAAIQDLIDEDEAAAQPAPGDEPRAALPQSAYLYHCKFNGLGGDEYGLFWRKADADAAAAKRAGEGYAEVLGVAILGDRLDAPAAPGMADAIAERDDYARRLKATDEAYAKAASERDKARELLEEVGVLAANAPEDGDSFGLLEEIAMRVAAHGVPVEGK